MGTLYIDTSGSANNSGSSDGALQLSGSAAAFVSGTTVSLLTDNPDLSGLITSGATQSAINIAGATNSNRTIFWITGFDNTAGIKTVTLDVAPTGMTANAWVIGGRHVLTSARVEGALRAGDTAIFNNSPAAAAATIWTFRTAGNSTSGFAKIVGKTGTRPVFNTTNTAVCVTSAVFGSWTENIEVQQNGASGNGITQSSGGIVLNVKVSDAGGAGVVGTQGSKCSRSEITGTSANGYSSANNNGGLVTGNYIHDLTGVGVLGSAASQVMLVEFNVIDTCSDRGIHFSGAPAASPTWEGFAVRNNTVYANGNSGLEVTDADAPVNLVNNILSENGNAAGEFNVEWVAGSAEMSGVHDNNCFFSSGGGGSANLSGLTATATEATTDPLFTNPSGGDFSLGAASPCKATGFPGQILGGNLGYLDMGAIQRQESGIVLARVFLGM